MRRTMNERTTEETLKDVVKVVFLKYKLFLAGFAIFVVGTMVVSHYLPMKYTSMTRFERRSDSATDTISKNNRNESFEAMKPSLEDELCSEQAVRAVVQKLGLTRDLPRDDKGNLTQDARTREKKLIKKIQKGLRVDWKFRSTALDQIDLYCTYTDQALAAAIPNALVDHYQTTVAEQITRRLAESRDFLKKEVQKAQNQVDRLNTDKVKFESQYGEVLTGSDKGIQDRIGETQADIENLYREKLLAEQKLQQVKALYQASRNLELKNQIKEVKNRIDQCLIINQMTKSHPEVQKLQAQLNQLKSRLNADTPEEDLFTGAGQANLDSNLALQITAAKSDIEQIVTEISRLENRLEGYQAVLVKSVPLREEYLKFTKPLEEQQAQLARWKNLLTEAEMTLTAEESNRRTQFSTVLLAKKTDAPQFPPLWTILGIAMGGGLAFGYALAFIGNSMDHTLRNPQDAIRGFQDFNVPVVGVISEIMTSKEKISRQIRSGVLTLVAVIIALASLGASTYSAVYRLQQGAATQTRENTFPQVVHYNESDLANRPIRIQ